MLPKKTKPELKKDEIPSRLGRRQGQRNPPLATVFGRGHTAENRCPKESKGTIILLESSVASLNRIYSLLGSLKMGTNMEFGKHGRNQYCLDYRIYMILVFQHFIPGSIPLFELGGLKFTQTIPTSPTRRLKEVEAWRPAILDLFMRRKLLPRLGIRLIFQLRQPFMIGPNIGEHFSTTVSGFTWSKLNVTIRDADWVKVGNMIGLWEHSPPSCGTAIIFSQALQRLSDDQINAYHTR